MSWNLPALRSHRMGDEGDSSLPRKRHRGAPSGPFTPATCFPRRLGPPGRTRRGAPLGEWGWGGVGGSSRPPPPPPAAAAQLTFAAPASRRRAPLRSREDKAHRAARPRPRPQRGSPSAEAAQAHARRALRSGRAGPGRAAASAWRTIARQKGSEAAAAAGPLPSSFPRDPQARPGRRRARRASLPRARLPRPPSRSPAAGRKPDAQAALRPRRGLVPDDSSAAAAAAPGPAAGGGAAAPRRGPAGRGPRRASRSRPSEAARPPSATRSPVGAGAGRDPAEAAWLPGSCGLRGDWLRRSRRDARCPARPPEPTARSLPLTAGRGDTATGARQLRRSSPACQARSRGGRAAARGRQRPRARAPGSGARGRAAPRPARRGPAALGNKGRAAPRAARAAGVRPPAALGPPPCFRPLPGSGDRPSAYLRRRRAPARVARLPRGPESARARGGAASWGREKAAGPACARLRPARRGGGAGPGPDPGAGAGPFQVSGSGPAVEASVLAHQHLRGQALGGPSGVRR